MREAKIWKIVLILLGALMLALVVVRFDPGFLRVILGDAAIPVSTGAGIEVVVTQKAPISGSRATTLYRFEGEEGLRELASFGEQAACVTSVDGRVFITFASGDSSIFENGKWVRGVARPEGMRIIDVCGYAGRLYAFGQSPDNRTIAVRVLEERGWREPAEPFDAAKQVLFAGCIDVKGGIEVLYATAAEGRFDIDRVRWYRVSFDGNAWGDETPVMFPERMMPTLASYRGGLAFVLLPLEKGKPVKIAVLDGKDVRTVAEVPRPGKGSHITGWLVSAGEKGHLFLNTGGSVWHAEFSGLEPGPVHNILAVSQASRVRSSMYVGFFLMAAVLLVVLGSAWFYVRLRKIRGGEEG